jgi:hypothetical protein
MRKLQPTEDALLHNIAMVYSLSPFAQGGQEQLEKLLSEQSPNLVIIDTFLALVGNSGAKKDVMRSEYAEIAALQKLATKHDTSILLVHHLRKANVGDNSVLDAVAGSTGVTAAADAIWGMKREDASICSLEVVGRECEEQSLGLRFLQGDAVGWELIGSGEQIRDAKDETEIMTLLVNEGSLTINKVATLLRMNANRARSVMYSMAERGFISRLPRGMYGVNQQSPAEDLE